MTAQSTSVHSSNTAQTTVLLVEDSDMDARRIETMFRYTIHGVCEIHRARSMADAIDKLSTVQANVVLLDLGLPDSDGIDGIATIQRMAQDTPIIVLTGDDDFRVGLECIRAGAAEYILKNDISTHTIERTIYHAIERKVAQRKLQRFYAQSMRGAMPTVAEMSDLRQQNDELREVIAQLQTQLQQEAPGLSSKLGDRITRITQPILAVTATQNTVSASDHAKSILDSMGDGSHRKHDKPKDVLSDVLSRYQPK